MIESLKSDESRVLAARTRDGMGHQLGWLSALPSLDQSGVLHCSISKGEKRLLLTGRGADMQMRQNNFVLWMQSHPSVFVLLPASSIYLCTSLHGGLFVNTIAVLERSC